MKTLNKSTKAIFTLLLLFIISMTAFFLIPSKIVYAAEDFSFAGDAEGYKTSYVVKDEIDIPAGIITIDGQEYTADGIITYPNGVSKNVDKAILDQQGKYSVKYLVSTGLNSVFEKEFSFIAYSNYYTFNNDLSFATFGADTTEYQIPGDGLTVSIQNGDLFTFNKPINVAKLTSEDKIVTFTTLPYVMGSPDSLMIEVVLTDCYNPNNYITMRAVSGEYSYGSDYAGITYFSASSSANPGKYVALSDKTSGHTTYFFFNGTTGNKVFDSTYYYEHFKHDLGFTLDYSKRQAFTKDPGYGPNKAHLLADYDDLSKFTEPWLGFTTGECFLSIKTTVYNGSATRLFIKEIAGLDTLEDKTIVDNEPPELTIDFGVFDEYQLPNAYVGCKFPIFDASAIDLYSDVKIHKNVYFKYAENKILVDFDEDGFIPTEEGLYTIEYIAEDRSGNKTEPYLVNIECKGTPALDVILDNSGIRNVNIGQTVYVDDYTTKNSAGYESAVITATNGNEVIVVEKGKFVPTKEGTYTIKYKVSDYVGQIKEISYDINCTLSNGPVFSEITGFERYYANSFNYQLPVATAFDYNLNEVASVKTYIKEDGVVREITGKYRPVATSDGKAYVYYVATVGSNSTTSQEFEINIVDSALAKNNIDAGKLFVTENGSSEATNDYVVITSNEGSKTMSSEFARAVYMKKYSIIYAVKSLNANFKRLTWTFTDTVDPSISISYSAQLNAEGKLSFYLNDVETAATFASTFVLSEDDLFSITYNGDTRTISDGNKINYQFTKTLSGEDFNGFTNGYAYVSFKVEGIEDTPAKIIVQTINSQKLSIYKWGDRNDPFVYVENYSNRQTINSVFTVPKAVCYDVLDPDVELKVTVRFQGSPVKDINGNLILNRPYSDDISFKMTAYGNYTIVYSPKDSTGNGSDASKTVGIIDDVPPVISSSKPGVNGKVITINKGSAIDNIDGDIVEELDEPKRFVAYVTDTTGWINSLKFNNNTATFTATEPGLYKVTYIAFDKAGNMSCVSYNIIIK